LSKQKIGRNEMCPCGSGKKYKKCCLLKENNNEIIEEAEEFSMTRGYGLLEGIKSEEEFLNLFQTKAKEEGIIYDKYLSKFKYVEETGYPVTYLDYLILEMLNVCGYVINEFNVLKKTEIEKILIKVLKEMKVVEKCIKDVIKESGREDIESILKEKMSLSDFGKNGLFDMFPKKLKKETMLNYFYGMISRPMISELPKALSEYMNKEKAAKIAGTVYLDILDYISNNCQTGCKNKCMKKMNENGYCVLCKMGELRLKCPKKDEISYEEIKASESDMQED